MWIQRGEARLEEAPSSVNFPLLLAESEAREDERRFFVVERFGSKADENDEEAQKGGRPTEFACNN